MRGRVGRGLLALISGAALGQLILVLATPFLARIYGAAAFGSFSALIAAASVMGPAAALKFDVGVVLPAGDDEARRLVRLALASSTALSAATCLVIWGVSATPMGRSWASIPFAPLWGGVLVLATAVFTILTQAALRQRAYGVVAQRPLFQSLGATAAQLGFGLAGAQFVGLTAGFVLGRFVGFVPLIKVARPLLASPKTGSYRDTVRRYRRLPTALTGAAMINSFGSNLPLLLIASAFGDAAAGEFGMAQRLVMVPATLLGASVAQIVGAELAQLLREKLPGARDLYRKATMRLTIAAVAVAVGIVVLAPLLPFLLGEDWARTVPIAQALALVAAVGLVGSPLSQVYTVFQSKATVIVDATRVALVLLAWIAVDQFALRLVEATWALSIAQTLGYVLLWWYGRRLVGGYEKSIMPA